MQTVAMSSKEIKYQEMELGWTMDLAWIENEEH